MRPFLAFRIVLIIIVITTLTWLNYSRPHKTYAYDIEIFMYGLDKPLEKGAGLVPRWNSVQQTGDTIASWEEVNHITYTSSRMESFPEPKIETDENGDPLPARYLIKLKNPDDAVKIAGRIKALPYIKAVVDDPDKDIRYHKYDADLVIWVASLPLLLILFVLNLRRCPGFPLSRE